MQNANARSILAGLGGPFKDVLNKQTIFLDFPVRYQISTAKENLGALAKGVEDIQAYFNYYFCISIDLVKILMDDKAIK